MSAPRVLLMRLSCRTSSKGTEYLSGWLGCSRVVAFKASEPDKFGNPTWELYVAEPEPKREQDRPAREPDLPTGETREYHNPKRDPRQEYAEELAARFQPDEGIPF